MTPLPANRDVCSEDLAGSFPCRSHPLLGTKRAHPAQRKLGGRKSSFDPLAPRDFQALLGVTPSTPGYDFSPHPNTHK